MEYNKTTELPTGVLIALEVALEENTAIGRHGQRVDNGVELKTLAIVQTFSKNFPDEGLTNAAYERMVDAVVMRIERDTEYTDPEFVIWGLGEGTVTWFEDAKDAAPGLNNLTDMKAVRCEIQIGWQENKPVVAWSLAGTEGDAS